MLLGRDAEPWARRGGLFGELQVRVCLSLAVGAERAMGSQHPNPAAELLQTWEGRAEGRAAPGLCTSAVVPGVSGVSEPFSCCLQDEVWSQDELMGSVSSRHCCPWGTAVTSSTIHPHSSHPASCTCCAHCCPWTRWELWHGGGSCQSLCMPCAAHKMMIYRFICC